MNQNLKQEPFKYLSFFRHEDINKPIRLQQAQLSSSIIKGKANRKSYLTLIIIAFLFTTISITNLAQAITVNPSTLTVLTGTFSSGTPTALVSNDNVFYEVNSTTTGTRIAEWYGSFPSVPNGLGGLNVNYRGKNSRSCTQSIAIWNWTSSLWVQLDSRTVSTTEIAINNLTPGGTFADYVSGTTGNGEVRVKVKCQSTANLISRGEIMNIVYTLPNTPPSISTITNQATNEDTATGAIAFTVSDAETAAGSLMVSGSSSNTALVPNTNLTFGGTGANRTVNITPAANQSGSAIITVSVSDGQAATPTSFQLTVNAINDAPTISSITDQSATTGTVIGPLNFTIADVDTALASLTISSNSSNTVLVPNGNIVIGGSGANRTVTITPATNQTGSATITLTVNDGVLSSTTSFQVNVTAISSGGGLVSGWSFNEGAGLIAGDLSGNSNIATLGNVSMWGAGEYGGGINFTGLNFLSVQNSASLNISGSALTISMWINPQPLSGGDSVVLGKFWNTTMTSPFYQYGIELNGGNQPFLQIGTPTTILNAPMGTTLPYSQWSHLAVTFNGSEARFYLNGSLVSIQPLVATITARGNQLNIGADANGNQIFNGNLDDIRIYSRVLTQADIQTDMNTPLGGGTGSAPTVSITFPTPNAQVHDIVTATADASDDIAVVGVQFLVDGVITGAEDFSSPYALTWDTRTVANGAHTLTARARDGSSNVTTSAPLSVNVANTNFFQNEILATGFTLPTSIKFLPDGRMLVAELAGTIKVLPPPFTTPDPTPFLQLNLNIPGYAGLQQGIFDIMLDPNFAVNHYYYLFYTKDTPNRDRLSRFTANSTLTGTVAGSEVILYEDPQVPNTEHHGGAINFGNDGKIYFTTGEHFNAANAQDLTNPRGKIHRINPDGTIPTDNPFYDGTGPHWDSIWAYGLRNPYRAFYDVPTGKLYIGDVGGNDYSVAKEEVNVGVAGANFGWPNFEGPCSAPCTAPLYFYPHNGRDASITGGFIYHGTQFPSAYRGNYFFADYAQNWIRRLTLNPDGSVNSVFNFEPLDGSLDGPYGDIVYLTEGPDGALYYVDLGYSDVGGTFGISKIRRIRYVDTNQAPVAVSSVTPTSGPNPLTVFSFSSNGSLDPEGLPLSYAWTFGDGTTSTEANPTHFYNQNGQYTVRLSVSDGVNTTLATPLFINVGNPPTVNLSVQLPLNATNFRAGDQVTFSGTAFDNLNRPLPASAYTWSIDFLHAGHVHPGILSSGITNGNFVIPTSGHDFSGDTRYRVMLTVTDADGLQSSQSVLVYPDKVNLPFDTIPTGLTLYLDGIANTAPFVHDTVPGFNHTIEARNQTQGANSYTFSSWSDGGSQQHGIVVPSTGQSYTAAYNVASLPLPSGLVGAWGFNEGSGTATGDTSGNANTGTLINGTSWATGRYGNGLSFNGVNNYLSIPDSSSLNISGSEITLTMWINPQALSSGDSVILGKFWNTTMTSPYYQYGLELTSGNIPAFHIGTLAGVLKREMGGTLPYNQWSHLAIVFNGSQVLFYLNGTLNTTSSLAASITARNLPINIGADKTPSQFHMGLLDEVRIYNRALTASEVQTDMTTGTP